jgi:hypothetical protein
MLEEWMSIRPAARTLAATVALAAALALSAPSLQARQQQFPLAPNPPTGLTVSPFFEGWYANPDGSYDLSLGYFNRNSREPLYIPRGPNNFITPAEFDGFQPEHFPPRRVRGVFTVTIPEAMVNAGQRVTWTLVVRGDTLSVPAGARIPSYQLAYLPMAMGSLPPVITFEPGGESGRGPRGIVSPTTYRTGVAQPIVLRFTAIDDPSMRADTTRYPINVGWVTHQGPALATFADEVMTEEVGGGEASVTVTFSEPGEYVIRGQADNFDAPDSAAGDQCCWSNAYFRVTVTSP